MTKVPRCDSVTDTMSDMSDWQTDNIRPRVTMPRSALSDCGIKTIKAVLNCIFNRANAMHHFRRSSLAREYCGEGDQSEGYIA